MKWLDPQEVREWLEAPCPSGATHNQGLCMVMLAWAEFGRAVAAQLRSGDKAVGLWDDAVEVARIIRDAGEGK